MAHPDSGDGSCQAIKSLFGQQLPCHRQCLLTAIYLTCILCASYLLKNASHFRTGLHSEGDQVSAGIGFSSLKRVRPVSGFSSPHAGIPIACKKASSLVGGRRFPLPRLTASSKIN